MCGNVRCRQCGSAILQEVMDDIAAVLRDSIEDFEMRIEHGADNSVELHKQLVDRLEKKLLELQELEAKQWDEKIKGEIPDHVFQRLNTQTVADIEDVTQALCDARSATPQHVDLQDKVATFRDAIAILKDPDAPAKEVNRLLHLCIERIDYSRPKPEKAGGRCNKEPFSLDFTLRV